MADDGDKPGHVGDPFARVAVDDVGWAAVGEGGESSAEDFHTYFGAFWVDEAESAWDGGCGDVPASFVDCVMVKRTQEHKVFEFCWPSVDPVNDVMGV